MLERVLTQFRTHRSLPPARFTQFPRLTSPSLTALKVHASVFHLFFSYFCIFSNPCQRTRSARLLRKRWPTLNSVPPSYSRYSSKNCIRKMTSEIVRSSLKRNRNDRLIRHINNNFVRAKSTRARNDFSAFTKNLL